MLCGSKLKLAFLNSVNIATLKGGVSRFGAIVARMPDVLALVFVRLFRVVRLLGSSAQPNLRS